MWQLIGWTLCIFPTPSYWAPQLPMFPLEFHVEVKRQKTRVMGRLCSESSMILTSTVLNWSTHVTDRQTDGRAIACSALRYICCHVQMTSFSFSTSIQLWFVFCSTNILWTSMHSITLSYWNVGCLLYVSTSWWCSGWESDLWSKGRWFDSRPGCYQLIYAFHPTGVGKSSTGLSGWD